MEHANLFKIYMEHQEFKGRLLSNFLAWHKSPDFFLLARNILISVIIGQDTYMFFDKAKVVISCNIIRKPKGLTCYYQDAFRTFSFLLVKKFSLLGKRFCIHFVLMSFPLLVILTHFWLFFRNASSSQFFVWRLPFKGVSVSSFASKEMFSACKF